MRKADTFSTIHSKQKYWRKRIFERVENLGRNMHGIWSIFENQVIFGFPLEIAGITYNLFSCCQKFCLGGPIVLFLFIIAFIRRQRRYCLFSWFSAPALVAVQIKHVRLCLTKKESLGPENMEKRHCLRGPTMIFFCFGVYRRQNVYLTPPYG